MSCHQRGRQKKELIGRYQNKGREWRPKGCPEEVSVYDFVDRGLGKVTPYGIYDLARNDGFVNVGTSGDTSEFAVESIRRWWRETGRERYGETKKLLVTADGGGSNGSRARLWKKELQKMATETGLEITVCHFPPGTSKWNKIEHRMFSQITRNWRGRPLESLETVVSLIGNTTTETGLRITARLDENVYERGRKVTKSEMDSIPIRRNDFHGEWNYTITP